MEFQEILTAVSTVGFPIVMCGGLFWYMINQRESHKEEMSKMTEAINNNTIVLQKLLDKMGGDV